MKVKVFFTLLFVATLATTAFSQINVTVKKDFSGIDVTVAFIWARWFYKEDDTERSHDTALQK